MVIFTLDVQLARRYNKNRASVVSGAGSGQLVYPRVVRGCSNGQYEYSDAQMCVTPKI